MPPILAATGGYLSRFVCGDVSRREPVLAKREIHGLRRRPGIIVRLLFRRSWYPALPESQHPS